ncbi:MAG: hypothetical protein KDK26_01600 [Roseivivax sp.]|nr:hypothetical protein [Roseivivax sp.]
MTIRLLSAALGAVLAVSGAVSAQGLVPEAQVPTGQFTTAVEVRPILQATRANWIAVREYEGKDLLYVTHLMSWRCGLAQLRLSINGGPFQDWALPPCHMGTNAPNAITENDGPIYIEGPLGAVQSVVVEITYDDLQVETAEFTRPQVLMP